MPYLLGVILLMFSCLGFSQESAPIDIESIIARFKLDKSKIKSEFMDEKSILIMSKHKTNGFA